MYNFHFKKIISKHYENVMDFRNKIRMPYSYYFLPNKSQKYLYKLFNTVFQSQNLNITGDKKMPFELYRIFCNFSEMSYT